MTAIIQRTIEDSDATMNERRNWLSLETILDAFIDMIEKGKIRAVTEDFEFKGERISPCDILLYSNYDL
jgi:hypothetical protein